MNEREYPEGRLLKDLQKINPPICKHHDVKVLQDEIDRRLDMSSHEEPSGSPPEVDRDRVISKALSYLRSIQHNQKRTDAITLDSAVDIQRAESLNEGLEKLLDAAGPCGISAIRLYEYTCTRTEGERLVSVDGVGHDLQTTRDLQVGHIVKFRDQCPLEWRDSFWAIEWSCPVFFVIDPNAEAVLVRDKGPGGLPLIRMREDQCDNVLARHSVNAWIDFPLVIGNKIVGKLSCDLVSLDLLDDSFYNKIMNFWKLVRVTGSHLYGQSRSSMDEKGLDHLRQQAGEIIDRAQSLDAFYDACTLELSKLLGCKFASIFVKTTDSRGVNNLVLKRTTYWPSKGLEGSSEGTYSWDEAGLTPWIARKGISICLQDLGDTELYIKKLKAYDPRLEWKNKVIDAKKHGGFLGVAIRSSVGETLGVLRFTTPHVGHFTQSTQDFIEKIVRRYIAHKLQQLHEVEASRRVLRDNQVINTLAVQSSANFGLLKSHLSSTMSRMFPEGQETRKLYLFNYLNTEQNKFRHVTSAGKLSKIDQSRRLFPLDRTFTRYVIDRGDQVSYFADLRNAASQGQFRLITSDAVSAIGCRVASYGRIYGALIVLSDHFDLDPREHGPVLQLLASKTAETLTRLDLVRIFLKMGRVNSKDIQGEIQTELLHNGGYLTSGLLSTLFKDIGAKTDGEIRYDKVIRTVISSTPYADYLIECDLPPSHAIPATVAYGIGAIVLNLFQQAWERVGQTGANPAPCRIRAEISRAYLHLHIYGFSGILGTRPSLFGEEEDSRGLVESRRIAKRHGGTLEWTDGGRSLSLRMPL